MVAIYGMPVQNDGVNYRKKIKEEYILRGEFSILLQSLACISASTENFRKA